MDNATGPASMAGRLSRGETMVWTGSPAQGLLLTISDGLLIPFSLLWGGFAVYWETLALRGNMPLPFALFGIPFVLIGLFIVFGRFLLDGWLRARTIYAVTNHRILIARSSPWQSFTALNLGCLPEMTLLEKGDGRGTIKFGSNVSFFYMNRGLGSWVPVLDPTPQFLIIENARHVFAEIENQSARLMVSMKLDAKGPPEGTTG